MRSALAALLGRDESLCVRNLKARIAQIAEFVFECSGVLLLSSSCVLVGSYANKWSILVYVEYLD